MAAIAILNFTETVFSGQHNTRANIYLNTKFDANIFIGNQDMAQKSKSKWRPLPI